MENHPIPQDVTGFQFKLIGDMTLKQFVYVCVGVIFAWIFFSTHIFTPLKLLLSLFFLLTGILLSFVPLEGRPMDQMIMFFFKAVFSTDQFLYHKTGREIQLQLATKETPKNRVSELPSDMSIIPKVIPAEAKTIAVSTQASPNPSEIIIETPKEQAASKAPLPAPAEVEAAPIPQDLLAEQKRYQTAHYSDKPPEEDSLKEELEKEKNELAQELKDVEAIKEQEKKSIVMPSDVHNKLLELEKKLEETMSHKQRLEEELIVLQKKLDQQKQPTFSPSTPVDKPQSTPLVKKITKTMSKTAGIAVIADAPNIIIGIVKDPRGNVLPNILVEVQDTEENPVRAFKTNAVGQFASATPLKNGTYTISFEDPENKNSFDTVEITADGQLLDPIEVVSHDQRENLHNALFNTTV